GPVDRLAEALTRPAAETLALDKATTRSDSPVLSDRAQLTRQSRQLADRRRALDKERTQTATKLHETMRELAGLGALARARHGRSLREQIGERERTLAHLDRELERLER